MRQAEEAAEAEARGVQEKINELSSERDYQLSKAETYQKGADDLSRSCSGFGAVICQLGASRQQAWLTQPATKRTE